MARQPNMGLGLLIRYYYIEHIHYGTSYRPVNIVYIDYYTEEMEWQGK
jgi:hypothetical protein